jgi:hypothetical protein
MKIGARGSVLYATSQKIAGSRPDYEDEFFKLIESFQPHLAQGFTQPLTELGTRNRKIIMFPGSRAQQVLRTENLTAMYK